MSSLRGFTSAIGPILARFVAYKRTMGLRYDPQCRLLEQFDRFLGQANAPDLTRETFAAWCSSITTTASAASTASRPARTACGCSTRRTG